MANLSPEREQEIRYNIKNFGTAVHNPGGWMVPSNNQAKLYNAAHGTNFVDDKALERYEDNKRELRAFEQPNPLEGEK